MKQNLELERLWKFKSNTKDSSADLSQSLNISPITAQILVRRGINSLEDARLYLDCKLKDLEDPFLLEGMDRAVTRIFKALHAQELVMIHGDYDVDGITGTALLCEFFSRIGIKSMPYIPDRVSEGYGISLAAIAKAKNLGIKLLITVDCGSSAFEEIKEAIAQGLDVIIVDHHELKESIPNCIAVIHPRRIVENSNPALLKGVSSFQHLAAVGVAFKLAHALMKQGLKQKEIWATRVDLRDLLDRVAIGTVADLVPLKGENKTLVKHGLEKLQKTDCLGLRAMLSVMGSQNNITATDIAFKIAPRMNAAGRVGTAYDAIRLLLSKDSQEAYTLARGLDDDNRKRQALELRTYEEAVKILDEELNKDDWVIVLHKEQWPLGVIGIVASRVVRLKHRPTFIISSENGISKGSARSIRGFHLCKAMKECSDLLLGFGGHAYAAGIKINKEKISEFRNRINQYAKRVLSEEDLKPSFEIDLEVPIEELSLKLAEEFLLLSPFGQENHAPLLSSRGLFLNRAPQIVGRDHLKVWLKKEGQDPIEGIAFGMATLASQFNLDRSFDAIYEIGVNEYNAVRKLQLNFKDFKFNEPQVTSHKSQVTSHESR